MHCAKRAILKHNPGIIAITGGVGTAMTQAALCGVLYDIRSLRATNDLHENRIRLPLAALGNIKEGSGFFFWISIFISSIKTCLFTADYPELLVLSCPQGESKTLLAIARPQIVIVTALENQNTTDAERIITALPLNGYAIVNYDDSETHRIIERSRAREITFGFKEGADFIISNLTYRSEKTHDGYKPIGIAFTVQYGNQSAHIVMDNAFGKDAAYATAAAMCVGTAFGLHLARTAEALRYLTLPKNCMGISIGKKGIYVLNDTATRTEAGMRTALEALLEMPAKRIIGVFGAVAQKNGAGDEEEVLNRLAIKACNAVITVGNSPITVDSKKKIRFDNGEAAATELQAIIERNDLVLVTGQGLEAVIDSLCSYRLVVRT